MARKLQKAKPLIYIFCEGESEQAYAAFLKEHFSDAASFKFPASTGLFSFAESKFSKDARYRNSAEVTDEIWFFFDVEESDHGKWNDRLKIIQNLRRLRKKPNIRVRLLMTTACVEYWFMLHYQMMAPALTTVANKERMRHLLESKVPGYEKGDKRTTTQIAQQYPTAIRNGRKVLENLQGEGLPALEDTDERNQWLHQSSKTFTTVHEAVSYLEELLSVRAAENS